MTNDQRRRFCRNKYKVMSDHDNFLERIAKSLYYGRMPKLPCLSLPVTELSSEMFSKTQKGRSLKRLHMEDAAELSRNACVSPCSLVIALLYLERLKNTNPDYVSKMAPSELFLVTLMVSNKFLQDDGEDDEVFCREWAFCGGITLQDLHQLEWEFLDAIDWRLYVGEENFQSGLKWLEHQVALRQAKFRGWFTYTDMVNVKTFPNINLMKCLFTVYLALSVSYLASILTLVASSYVVSQGTSLISDYNSLATGLQSKQLYNEIATNYSANNNYTSDTVVIKQPNAFLDTLTQRQNTASNTQVYYNNKTIDFRIQAYYLPTWWPLLRSDTLASFWQTLVEIELLKIVPNLLSRYMTTSFKGGEAMNDIYLNIRHPSTSWYQRESYSLAWQHPGSVRY